MKLATRIKAKHILLDTNVIIYQLNGKIDIADDLVVAASLNISAITQAELFAGVAPSELIALKDYLAAFTVVPVSSNIATLAGAYKASMPDLALKDLLISATAELGGFTLVTGDKGMFKGVTTVSPVYISI